MFFVTPEKLTGVDTVTQAGETTRAALQARPVGGIAYFADNLTDPEQTRTLLSDTQAMARELTGIPLLLSVDEEGGTVARIARNAAFGVENPGDMRDVGSTGDTSYAHDVALTIGTYLRDLGFNLDFAPVCDIASNPDSDVMARRSFGDDPQLVADMVAAQVEGFAQAGMPCSAKHFPGIGAALGDSHDVNIVSEKSVEELAIEELIPFERVVSAGVPLVMVGHLSLPVATGSDEPACLNPHVVTDLLRDRLRFAGLIISDSLEMGAVTQLHDSAEAAVLGIQAGLDLLLMPEDFDTALEGVMAALADGTITEDRIDESVSRILTLKFSRL
ncbi:MAG: glycoside hydrolase family 3 protein [Coriobacteriia bacterium]|nr:glycoside hydrolase family 3 protein [Coriobacteriia bacterium]